MNKTTLNSQKEKHSMLSLRRATRRGLSLPCRRRYFYPRSPCGERHVDFVHFLPVDDISIHALLAESDTVTSLWRSASSNFYPRSPCGERRLKAPHKAPWRSRISIHALLAESDGVGEDVAATGIAFLSTLSLRRATDPGLLDLLAGIIFLSTLSLRRATTRQGDQWDAIAFLSTLSLRRATQAATWSTTWTRISIHALLAESDDPADSDFAKLGLFLSTLSLRRATNPDAGRGLL